MSTTNSALLSLDDALARLLTKALPTLGSEIISIFEADGRVLSQDIISAMQVPSLDNSAMDGYALRCADVSETGTVLPVSQRVPAGGVGCALQAGTVARIFTGAPLPEGADAVVMQEVCEAIPHEGRRTTTSEVDDSPESSIYGKVRIQQMPHWGQAIRRAGEDITRGSIVLAQGQRLDPASIGLAASIGAATLPVACRPRVALFSTGDELVMPGEIPPEALPPGSIYNSNRFFLRTLLQRLGCSVTDMGIVPDQLEATQQALQEAAKHHDLILTSGGVSVGEEDHIKPAVLSLGTLDMWRIAIKPGKPFAYGQIRQHAAPGEAVAAHVVHFIGLPGNPVSSYVTFVLLVRPFLLQLQGVRSAKPAVQHLPAHFTWPKPDARREFLRARRNSAGGLDLFPNQSSGVLTSVVWGDGLVDKHSDQIIDHGDMVRFIPFNELLT